MKGVGRLLLIGLGSCIACRPAAIDWGLGAIDAMKTPVDDPGLGCGVAFADDSKAVERAHCTYPHGTTADLSLGVAKSDLSRIPIRHVIIAMKENRSFDHVFGKLHDQGQPGVEAIPPSFSNPDANGRPVSPRHATTTCIPFDPGHQSEAMRACVNGGRMDGFIANAAATTSSDGSFALDYYDASDVPFTIFSLRPSQSPIATSPRS